MRSFGPFRLDIDNQCLWRGESRIALMPKPFAILEYLVANAGRLVTQDQLLGAIWPDTYVQREVLRRYILEIRRALNDSADAPRFVQTFPKRGYRFIAPVADGVIAPPPDAGVTAGRLVGRNAVLADLSRHLGAALSGRRQIVFVVGEPGIGKTSVVDAFQRECAAVEAVVVVRGQSVEGFGGKEAYYPLLEAIGQLGRGPARSLVVETLAAYAPTWLIQLPALVSAEQQAALQRDLRGTTRERMVRELCEALDVITQTIPLVVILEDLHWVDHSTLDIISAIARRREPAKLLLAATYRPADVILSKSPLKVLKQDLLLHRLGHEIELERLAESDVRDYLIAEFAPADVPSGLASIIHRHSDGNPLFMTAMLDHLAQQGVLARVDGRLAVTVPLEQVDPGVPDTLKQLLEIRLQHLGEAEQQLLKCASVAGQSFTIWAAATMLGAETSHLEEMCERLAERHQFLASIGTRELPDGASTLTYRFSHALYREVLYRRLSPTARVAYHQRLAEGLERLRTPVEGEVAAEIALHFEEGHQFERAVPYLMVAAQNATRRYAHRESIAVLEHACTVQAKVGGKRGQELELQVLERIGNAYYALGDMARSADSYRSMATRAAEAGLLRAQAEGFMRLAHPAEAIPYFLRAVELQPDFVAAYICLSRIYSNLGEAERARQYAQLAYDRRDQVCERERLSVTYQYHYEVTGDQQRATETLETWKASFPGEFQPVNSLAVVCNFLGSFERAVTEGREAIAREPSHGYPYSNLAHAYRGLGRFDAARRTAERAVALEIETLPTRRLLYQLAVLEGDDRTAAKQLEWARDRPREFDIVGARAQAAGWAGKVGDARQLYERAAQMAEVRNLCDVGTSHLAWASSMEWAYGNTALAVQSAHRVLGRRPSYDPRLRAALVLAAAGEHGPAEAIAADAIASYPQHTLINRVLVPIVRAAIELGQGRPARAIAQLAVVTPHELGFIAALAPLYLRGQAYLMLGDGAHAAREFQRLLEHRGSDPFSPFHAVAPLGLARACAIDGNIAGSVVTYERFLNAWKGADPDVPVLREARDEYARLTREPAPSAAR